MADSERQSVFCENAYFAIRRRCSVSSAVSNRQEREDTNLVLNLIPFGSSTSPRREILVRRLCESAGAVAASLPKAAQGAEMPSKDHHENWTEMCSHPCRRASPCDGPYCPSHAGLDQGDTPVALVARTR